MESLSLDPRYNLDKLIRVTTNKKKVEEDYKYQPEKTYPWWKFWKFNRQECVIYNKSIKVSLKKLQDTDWFLLEDGVVYKKPNVHLNFEGHIQHTVFFRDESYREPFLKRIIEKTGVVTTDEI